MKTSTDERREEAKEPTKTSPALQVPNTVGTSDIRTATGSTTTVHGFLSSSLPASAVTLCGAAAAVARLTIVEKSRGESQLVPKFTSKMRVSMQECLVREQPAQRLYLWQEACPARTRHLAERDQTLSRWGGKLKEQHCVHTRT